MNITPIIVGIVIFVIIISKINEGLQSVKRSLEDSAKKGGGGKGGIDDLIRQLAEQANRQEGLGSSPKREPGVGSPGASPRPPVARPVGAPATVSPPRVVPPRVSPPGAVAPRVVPPRVAPPSPAESHVRTVPIPSARRSGAVPPVVELESSSYLSREHAWDAARPVGQTKWSSPMACEGDDVEEDAPRRIASPTKGMGASLSRVKARSVSIGASPGLKPIAEGSLDVGSIAGSAVTRPPARRSTLRLKRMPEIDLRSAIVAHEIFEPGWKQY